MPKFNQSKNNSGFDFMATFRLVRSGVLGGLRFNEAVIRGIH